jgi:hypothetical protein
MSADTTRRAFLGAVLFAPLAAHATLPEVEVYKTPTCGCCGDWIKHLRAEGFKVKVNDVPDTSPYRARFGVAARYASCHTATVAGYSLEGHVPAREIRRLLRQQPLAVGLAVPGMPQSAPGMQQGASNDPFDVLLLTADGAASIYASYGRGGAR